MHISHSTQHFSTFSARRQVAKGQAAVAGSIAIRGSLVVVEFGLGGLSSREDRGMGPGFHISPQWRCVSNNLCMDVYVYLVYSVYVYTYVYIYIYVCEFHSRFLPRDIRFRCAPRVGRKNPVVCNFMAAGARFWQ